MDELAFRPAVDAVYMDATQAMTGRGGWPMTVFMTADGRPFYCGTYFPPDDRYGRPGLSFHAPVNQADAVASGNTLNTPETSPI